jgi:hypothetical protein
MSTILLSGCVDDDEVTKDTTNNDTADDIEDTDPGKNPATLPETTFDFKGIDIEIDVKDQEDAIKVHFEEKKDATDVQYTNTITGENEKGSQALDLLEPIFQKLSIAESHTNEEVVGQLADAFGVEDQYTQLDAKITFFNDKKKEYELKK